MIFSRTTLSIHPKSFGQRDHNLGSAYLFTLCAFQLLFGKLFVLFPIKYVYLGSVTIFEVGSAICGAAPNSTAFILGRAIAGIGAAGDFSGGLIIIANSVPLAKRPQCSTPFHGLKMSQVLIYTQTLVFSARHGGLHVLQARCSAVYSPARYHGDGASILTFPWQAWQSSVHSSRTHLDVDLSMTPSYPGVSRSPALTPSEPSPSFRASSAASSPSNGVAHSTAGPTPE